MRSIFEKRLKNLQVDIDINGRSKVNITYGADKHAVPARLLGMGNVPAFITPEEYRQLHEETGCECGGRLRRIFRDLLYYGIDTIERIYDYGLDCVWCVV